MSTLQIIEVTELEMDELVPLFNAYRVFYDQISDPEASGSS